MPRRVLSILLSLALMLVWGGRAQAGVVPEATDVPKLLTLDEALRIFRTRGLDLLIADANMRTAEGAVKVAGAVPNPTFNASVGNAITYSNSQASQQNCLLNGSSCSPWAFSVGLTDSAALEDSLSGKRDLRMKVARNALAAAKLSRIDAERVLVFQVKSTYAQVAEAVLAYEFAKEIQATNVTTLKKFQDRYATGAINEGDLQRIEVQKLESDQALDNALLNLRQARVALALLLGVRGVVPDFDVDTKVLDYAVPAPLRDASETGLLHTAFDRRPDLHAFGYQMLSSRAQIELVRRQRFPDITFGVTYAWGGFGGFSTNGPVGPQMLTFNFALPLPIFYQLSGELRQAEAALDTNALNHAKATAQVTSDVSSSMAAFVTARRLVERMEGPRRPDGGLIASAKGAFEVIARQYDRGAPGVTVTDYLDALRTYINSKLEYFGDLTTYWTAVYQLEQAVGMDLR